MPEQLIQRAIELAILFALYGTVAHGIQRFRTFQVVAGVLCATCVFIVAVCFHQGLSPLQCIGGEEEDGAIEGKPDGRECETSEECRVGDAEPGLEYRCEHVGAFGTFSVQERVRYRGELHDPNEVSLTICAGGLAMLIGFMLRKRGEHGTQILLALAVAMVVATVWMTQSRGGLVACMLVPGVYLYRRYGPLILLPALAVGVPVMLLGGRSGEAADTLDEDARATRRAGRPGSIDVPPQPDLRRRAAAVHRAQLPDRPQLVRADAVRDGDHRLLPVRRDPVPVREVPARRRDAALEDPGHARRADVGDGAPGGDGRRDLPRINTLSFAYHSVLWLFFGLVGGWCSAVRHHLPEFDVKLAGGDLVIIGAMVTSYAFVILPLFLKAKGMM